MNRPIVRLLPSRSIVVVIDIQEKLLPAMPTGPALIDAAKFLLDVAALLEVPVLATEQYPKGLGPTVEPLRQRLSTPILTKTAFSCSGAPGFLAELRARTREDVILVGMETHVCVQQTALDLLENGFRVVLLADALGSRHATDHAMALERMHHAGATVTTSESVAFEWLGDSQHPQFRAVSSLIIKRDQTRRDT
ncbi:MAG: hydrolase [Gemmataceae bacterium]